MSRTRGRWTGAGIVFFFIVVIWFFRNFDRIPVTVHVGANSEAMNNPDLALEKFLVRMGRPATIGRDAQLLDRLPAAGVLVLGAPRRPIMTKARVTELLAWVARGGHLLVDAERDDRDPLLEAIGVNVWRATPVTHVVRVQRTPIERQSDRSVVSIAPANEMTFLVRPGDRILRTSIGPSAPRLRTQGVTPEWSAGNRYGIHILHFVRGRGAITVIAPLDALAANETLGRYDNAEIVWTLLNLVNPRGPIILVSQLRIPSLWEWLMGSAWMVLTSGLIVLFLWLWRIVPRFGPVAASAVLERRGLVEHLAAMGLAVWRAGGETGLTYWLGCVRRSVMNRAAQRDSDLLRLSPGQQVLWITRRVADKTAFDAKAIRTALAGQEIDVEAGAARAGFTQVIKILQQVERTL